MCYIQVIINAIPCSSAVHSDRIENSPLSVSRTRDHRSLVLLLQWTALRPQCGHDLSALSLPPRNFPSFLPASYRAVVCAQCRRLDRHHSDQHLAVRNTKSRALAGLGCFGNFLDRRYLGMFSFQWHISRHVRTVLSF